MKRIFALLAPCAAALTLSACMGPSSCERLDDLDKRVAKLEAEAKERADKKAVEDRLAQQLKKAQQSAWDRMRQDSKLYSKDELDRIEKLYQVANAKWESDEAKESLKKLIAEYPKANRTGCAVLYMGQMSSGEESKKYLQRAIDEFSDCAYGDGVVVGAYARFYLAWAYWRQGDKEKAQKLVDEIKAKYPDAMAHGGRPLIQQLDTSKWD